MCPALVYLKTNEVCGSKLLSKTNSNVDLKVDTKSESESSVASTVTDAESNINYLYMYIDWNKKCLISLIKNMGMERLQ